MYAYSFHLFFDFAGYSAFAVGLSYLLGIHTPENFDRPFLAELVDVVVDRMGQHYPDLVGNAGRIKSVIASEEELFSRTLKTGSAQLERIIDEAQSQPQLDQADTPLALHGSEHLSRPRPKISGRQVFDLYQTYGFPVELTEEILRNAGLTFDRAEFDAALAAERERARSAGSSSTR